MKTVAALIVLAAVAACTWLVADGDRARMQAWGERFAAGAIEHVNDLLRHGAELRMEVERKDAVIARLTEDADDLRRQLGDMATELDAAQHRAPEVIVVHLPAAHRPHHKHHRTAAHCLDHIANELNAVEAARH